ncbi:hypothetical protein [Candidatus Sordicultor fermentans]|mgnify:CR=1 FL=1|jgi:hypothetical protein|uniref:hypothetical protein n=1 Tax=Candidatus Sordicultor fermentans TaxID=1953203 RepID=UPI0016AE7FEE|nr:hypothetical protein [Candidatus Atribacteria bacterium]
MSDNFNFEEIKKDLMEHINQNKIEVSLFKKAVGDYKKVGFELEKILEYAAKNAKGKDKRELEKLHNDVSLQNVSELCDRLKAYGEGLRGSAVYERFYDKKKKMPRGLTFRLLELTRMGKRDEVFYIILREFANAQQEINQHLVKAFNPRYSIESFKTLVYSFLSGLLG